MILTKKQSKNHYGNLTVSVVIFIIVVFLFFKYTGTVEKEIRTNHSSFFTAQLFIVHSHVLSEDSRSSSFLFEATAVYDTAACNITNPAQSNRLLTANQYGNLINILTKDYFLQAVLLLLLVIIYILSLSCVSKKKLFNAKQNLENVANTIPGGMAKCLDTKDYEFVYASNGLKNIIGMDIESLKSSGRNNLLAFVHPQDLNRITESLETQSVGVPNELEYRMVDCSRNIIWVLNKYQKAVDKVDGKTYLYCSLIDITDKKNAQQNYIISNERFRAAVEQASGIVFEYDCSSNNIKFATKAGSYFGFNPAKAQTPDLIIESGAVPDEHKNDFKSCFSRISEKDTSNVSVILRLKRADGKLTWNRLHISKIFGKSAVDSQICIGTFKDITQAKEATIRQKREEKYRQAMISDAIYIYEVNLTTDRYIKALSAKNMPVVSNLNESYSNLYKTVADDYIYPEDRSTFLELYSNDNLMRAFSEGRFTLYNEYRHLDRNGQSFWVSCTTNLLSDPISGEIKAFSYIKNIDERKRKELSIKYSSERDPLTGLYNRKAARELITNFLEKSDKNNTLCAFLSIDLDWFKNINDKYGHIAGDKILTEASICLRNVFDESDIVSRMGGDEFVVFMKGANSRVDIMAKALKACTALKKLIASSGTNRSTLSASVGIALYPCAGETFEELYRNSDKALYNAKNTGRDRCVFYDLSMADCIQDL